MAIEDKFGVFRFPPDLVGPAQVVLMNTKPRTERNGVPTAQVNRYQDAHERADALYAHEDFTAPRSGRTLGSWNGQNGFWHDEPKVSVVFVKR